MKAKLFLFIAMVITFSFSGTLEKKKTDIDFNSVETEIKWFIDKVKPESYKKGIHNVYIVKIIAVDRKRDYCITIGYFDNLLQVKYIQGFKYFMAFEEDLVLLDLPDDFKEKIRLRNANKIETITDIHMVSNRLDQDVLGVGIYPGCVCCFTNGCINKVYYEDSDEIPLEKAIFKTTSFDTNSIVDVDSSALKKILKGERKED